MTFYPPPGDPSAQPPDPNQGYPPPDGYPPPPGYPGYPPQGYGQPYGTMPPPPPGMYASDPVPGGRKAGMGARFGGYVLDYFIVSVPSFVIGFASGGLTKDTVSTSCDSFTGSCTTTHSFDIGFVPIGLTVAISLLYFGYMVGVRTQTLGHMAAGIRVVDVNTGNPIGFWRGVLRWIVLGLTGALCTLGFWSPFFDSVRRQGWHDKSANAVVIPAAGH